jgi:general stress protein 26
VPETEDHATAVKKLGELIRGIRFAMLTTEEENGALRSRPMATTDLEFDGTLWFFTRADSAKVWEAGQHRQVNVAYAEAEKNTFVSVSGAATLVRDRAKFEEYWKPAYKLFFPVGLDDPELALLRIDASHAEYWDSPSTKLGRAFNFARAFVTRDTSKLGDHAKVDLG